MAVLHLAVTKEIHLGCGVKGQMHINLHTVKADLFMKAVLSV